VGSYFLEEVLPDATPLTTVINEFKEPEAARLVQRLAEILEVAHLRRLVHGDLRPANIRLLPDGSPMLINAGSAYALRTVARSNPRILKDAAPYMAPDSDVMPEATNDVYALGAIFYELLTHQTPDVNAENTSPRRVNTSLSVVHDSVVRKAMEYERDDRYESMAAFLKDLKRYTPPEPARPLLKERIPARKPLPEPAPSLVTTPIPIIEPVAPIIEPVAPIAMPSVAITPNAPIVIPEEKTPTPMPANPATTMKRVESTFAPDLPVSKMPVVQEGGKPIPRRSTAWLTFLNLILAMVVIGMLYGLYQTVLPLFHPIREVVVPNLVDKTKSEAEKLAQENGFVLRVVDSIYNEKIPKDVILHQDPPPARIIREGKPIRIDLSRGPRMVEVPDITGIAMERARRILEKNGLKLGKYSGEFDVVVTKGNIMRQKPEAGEQLKRGGEVELVISKGEEMPIEQATPAPDVKPVETPLVDDNRERSFKVEYSVPSGGTDEHVIRIDINDAKGQGRTVYEQSLKPGTKLTHEVIGQGLTVDIFVYDNDEMQKQLTL
jgi:eukaryotic-like serine/threonine-protein kinase